MASDRLHSSRAAVVALGLAATAWSCNHPTPTSADHGGGATGSALAFTVSPIATSAIEFITPLGNLNPPDHTLPTDHIYFYHHLFHQGAPAYDVVAPAPGTVVAIIQHNGDQKLLVQVTATQQYYLDHVVLDANITQNTVLTAGQHLGQTSSGAYGIDLGVVNRQTTVGFVNPARYGDESVHADAPLKYFEEPMKSLLYGLVQRNGSDKDGTICFDQPGTLAGNWFLDTLAVSQSDVFGAGPMQVAFVHDVSDPSQLRISIGGTLAMAGIYSVTSGPDPATVTPASGQIPYQVASTAFGASSGFVLVQMTGPDTVRIEAFPDVPPAAGFTSAARTYVR